MLYPYNDNFLLLANYTSGPILWANYTLSKIPTPHFYEAIEKKSCSHKLYIIAKAVWHSQRAMFSTSMSLQFWEPLGGLSKVEPPSYICTNLTPTHSCSFGPAKLFFRYHPYHFFFGDFSESVNLFWVQSRSNQPLGNQGQICVVVLIIIITDICRR